MTRAIPLRFPSAVCMVAAALSVSALGAPLDQAQQPPAAFRTGVELLTIDVQVTPAKGTPLRALSAADFEVRISRVRRPVVSVTVLHDDDGPVTRSVSGGGDDTCVFGRRRKTDRPTVHYVLAVDRGAADRVEVSQVKVELTAQAFSIQGIAYRTPVRRGGRTGG